MELQKDEYSDEIKDFFKENKELIIDNNFTRLYDRWNKSKYNNYVLTNVLMDADVDPLPYMSKVPDHFMWQAQLITNIIIPDSITKIGKSAFYGCESLQNVVISKNVTDIDNAAFYECVNITDITLPDSVIYIGVSAFERCEALQYIKLSNNLRWIDSYAFAECDSLKSITLPKSLEQIWSYAFPGAVKLIYEGSKAEWKQLAGNEDYKDYDIEFLNK